MLRLGGLFVDLIMIYLMPLKKQYFNAKYVKSEDFNEDRFNRFSPVVNLKPQQLEVVDGFGSVVSNNVSGSAASYNPTPGPLFQADSTQHLTASQPIAPSQPLYPPQQHASSVNVYQQQHYPPPHGHWLNPTY